MRVTKKAGSNPVAGFLDQQPFIIHTRHAPAPGFESILAGRSSKRNGPFIPVLAGGNRCA